jgi:hypothetical protein
VSSGLLCRVALVRNDVSEEIGASFIRVTEIGELGTAQAATSNRRTLRRYYLRLIGSVRLKRKRTFLIRPEFVLISMYWSIYKIAMSLFIIYSKYISVTLVRIDAFLRSLRRLLVTVNVNPISKTLVTLMMEVLHSSEISVFIRATRRNILEYANNISIIAATRNFMRQIKISK